MAEDDDSLRQWRRSLDALQREVESALGLTGRPPLQETAGTLLAWSPLAELGPLPQILAGRARHLATLQQQAVDRLAEARSGVEHELAELAQLPQAQRQPVYLDVLG
jgi:hypothetical protein